MARWPGAAYCSCLALTGLKAMGVLLGGTEGGAGSMGGEVGEEVGIIKVGMDEYFF